MTAQEILNKIKELGISNSDFAWEYYDATPFGQIEKVKSWGGEDQGSDIGRVYHFKDHDVYLRIDGYYASHYGSDWDDDPYEVKPKEKTIVVYE